MQKEPLTRGQRAIVQICNLDEVLSQAGVTYWLDAGTLLGLVRDGCTLEGDKDADLGIDSASLDALHRALDAFRSEGYTFHKETYDGRLTAVPMFPEDRSEDPLNVTLRVYHRQEDTMWAPGTFKKKALKGGGGSSSRGKGGKGSRAWRPMLQRAYVLARAASKRIVRRWELTSWPVRLVRHVGTWTFPASYVDATKPLGDAALASLDPIDDRLSTLPAPSKCHAYLEHKYGDWRTPAPSWRWYEDEQGFTQETPHALGLVNEV